MSFQIEDFLEEYPNPYEDNIQSTLASYYEMQEVETTKKDRKLQQSPFFTQQELYQRVGYFTDRILYVAEAGVGKTCSEICLREFLKNNDPWTKNAYFITGTTQIDDFKKQVVYGCTAHLYEKSKLGSFSTSESNSKGLTKAINSIVDENYTVMTYDAFYKQIMALILGLSVDDANELITKRYSNSYFFFDEIHFLKITDSTDKNAKERYDHYWMLWRVCHLVNASRITLSSATPHSNNIKEIGHIANIILPLNNQILVDDDFFGRYFDNHLLDINYGKDVRWDIGNIKGRHNNLERASDYYTDVLTSYLSGMVMYIAAADTGVKISYIPVEEPNPYPMMKKSIDMYRAIGNDPKNKYNKLRIMPFKDGGIQMETYDRYVESMKMKGVKRSVAQSTELSILRAVVPLAEGLVENWETKGFRHWFVQENKKPGWYKIKDGVRCTDGRTLQEHYQNNLESLSSKYAYAAMGMTKGIGKCYAFFTGVNQIGGVYDFGIALENNATVTLLEPTSDRFTRFDYLPRTSKSRSKNWKSARRGELKNLIESSPRYAIISNNQTSAEISNILDLYNHPDNMYGEYLKVLLVSRKGQTGINFSSVRREYSMSSTHNPVDEYQAIMRAIRATSHTEIIPDWKKRFGEDFYIEINLMAIIYPNTKKGSKDTEDIMIYNRTRDIDENRLVINRALKRLSITGLLTEDRNRGNAPGSQECDYMSCDFDLVSEDRTLPTKYNNYIALYSQRAIDIEKLKIVEELKKKSYLSVSEYIKSNTSSEVENIVCQLAIVSLCENRDEIYDKFGYLATITENSGTLYFNRGNISQKEFMTEYYNFNLIGIQRRNLQDLNRLRDTKKTKAFFDDIANTKSKEDMTEFLTNADTGYLALVYEKFIKEHYISPEKSILTKDQIDNFYSLIELDKESGNVIRVPQPLEALAKVSSSTKKELPFDFEPLSQNDPKDDIVFAHSLYTTDEKRTKSSQAQKGRNVEGTLRIFIVKEGEWRDANVYESAVYRRIFQQRISSLEIEISTVHEIYGIISRNKEISFGIPILIIKNNEKATSREAPGSMCHQTPRKVDIFKVMISIGMHLENDFRSNEYELIHHRNHVASYKRRGDLEYLQRYFTSKGKDWYFSIDDFLERASVFYNKKILKKPLVRNRVKILKEKIDLLKNNDVEATRELYDEYRRIDSSDILRRNMNNFFEGTGTYTIQIASFVNNRIREFERIVESSEKYLKSSKLYDNYVRVALKMELIDKYDGDVVLATDSMTEYAMSILMTTQHNMKKQKICEMMASYMYRKNMLVFKDITEEEARKIYG